MKTEAAVSVSSYSAKELLSFLLHKARARNQPIAVWRLPGKNITQVILSEKARSIDAGEFLEELEPGFMMAPFERNQPRYFLPADLSFRFENDRLLPPSGPAEEAGAAWLAENLSKNFVANPYIAPEAPRPLPSPESREAFLDLVNKALNGIHKGAFEKIVPSRLRAVGLPSDFDVAESFTKLALNYPQALISFVNIPDVGSWLGATPELLVCVEDKAVFKTVALAGTLPYRPGTDLRTVAWSQKEIEEQALVERYLISCFKKIRLREYEEHGPRTVVAGNLMHLKSEFTVDMKSTNFPQIGTVMLDLLHPTSAVCGMPLEPSLEFLRKYEHYDRAFYAGYLGPVNIGNHIDLFVNLRCMQLSGLRAVVYAGAGVTIDSLPEKEWDETEMKFDTLLKMIL